MAKINKNSENNKSLVKSFQKVKLLDDKTKEKLGQLIYEKFHHEDTSVHECKDLLVLAWQFQIPQLEELLNDFENHFFKIEL